MDRVGSNAIDLFTGIGGGVEGDLYDTQNREYHPGQGRWLTPDPAGLAAVNLTNPQTWNRYAYVANNPLKFTDPLGLQLGYCDMGGGMSWDDADSSDGYTGASSCSASGGTWMNTVDTTTVTVNGDNPGDVGTYTSTITFSQNGPPAANNGAWQWIKNAARTIGKYIPVICGAGVYNTGGVTLEGTGISVTYRNIQVADSKAGYQSGKFGEINFGEGIQGGFGQALYSGGGKEDYFFGGLGLDVPLTTEVSISGFVAHTEGDPFLSNSIGIDFDGAASVLGGSAAGYLNTSSLTSCLSP